MNLFKTNSKAALRPLRAVALMAAATFTNHDCADAGGAGRPQRKGTTTMQKKPRRIVQCGLAVLLATCLTAQAQVVTVPPDLNTGDEYRLLFVTRSDTDATSANIAVYNAVAAADAAGVPPLAALGTTFTAVASTPTVDARDNTGTDPTPAGDTGVPIYLVDGTRFADNYDSLWTSEGPLVGGVPIPEWIASIHPEIERGFTTKLLHLDGVDQAWGREWFLGRTRRLRW